MGCGTINEAAEAAGTQRQAVDICYWRDLKSSEFYCLCLPYPALYASRMSVKASGSVSKIFKSLASEEQSLLNIGHEIFS
jgi:hypothetical protein